MYPIIQTPAVSVSANTGTKITNEVVYIHIMHGCILAPKDTFQAQIDTTACFLK